VLFQRGAFGPLTTLRTSDALLYYCVGMWPIAAGRIVVSAFHSVQDTRTPVKLSFIAFIANVILSLVLMGPMRHCGLALANSLSALLNTALLFYCFKERMGVWGLGWLRHTGVRVVLASAAMGLGLWALSGVLGWDEACPFVWKCLRLALWIAAGGGIYALACFVLRIKELEIILRPLFAQGSR
jgi:putative peptidoglycan lipid II flippase